jgi:hypothetical protein
MNNQYVQQKKGFHTMQLPAASGSSSVSVLVADIAQLVQEKSSKCHSFGKLLKDQICKSSDHSLTLVMYHDQAVPGNVLQPNMERKSTLVYCSFLELNHWLCKTYSWMTIAVMTDATVGKIADGMTAFVRHLMKLFQSTVLKYGICFIADGRTWHARVKDIAFIADEAALKSTWSNKGASGLRPCLRCQNVLRTDKPIPPPFVHISSADYTSFQIMTDEDVFKLADNLESMKANNVSVALFQHTQKVSGLSYAPAGLLWDKEVRCILPPSKANFDPMHVYFSGGIFGSETLALFSAVDALHKSKQIQVSSRDFETFAGSDWETPVSGSTFHTCRSLRQKWARLVLKDKGSASQALTMWPLLECFVRSTLSSIQALEAEVKSYLALCAVVRSVRRLSKQIGLDEEQRLLELQKIHMQLFISAYGRLQVRPKHHYQFHLGQQAIRWRQLLDCWCTERKHRDFKKLATMLAGNQRFEVDALVKLVLHETAVMVADGFHDGLQGNCLIANGRQYHPGTCLLFLGVDPKAFVVEEFRAEGGCVSAVGELWQLDVELH